MNVSTKEGQNSGHLCGRAKTANNRINNLRLRFGSWQSNQLSQVRHASPPMGRPGARLPSPCRTECSTTPSPRDLLCLDVAAWPARFAELGAIREQGSRSARLRRMGRSGYLQ